jgi:hypothetical protein
MRSQSFNALYCPALLESGRRSSVLMAYALGKAELARLTRLENASAAVFVQNHA